MDGVVSTAETGCQKQGKRPFCFSGLFISIFFLRKPLLGLRHAPPAGRTFYHLPISLPISTTGGALIVLPHFSLSTKRTISLHFGSPNKKEKEWKRGKRKKMGKRKAKRNPLWFRTAWFWNIKNCPLHELRSKSVSEWAIEWAQWSAQANQAVRSTWISKQCYQKSKRPSVPILVCSKPPWNPSTYNGRKGEGGKERITEFEIQIPRTGSLHKYITLFLLPMVRISEKGRRSHSKSPCLGGRVNGSGITWN